MKNEKGVTLIALVITIIVLIILAAVSIAMLTGDNGILSNADASNARTILSSAADRINLELNAFLTDIRSTESKSIEDDTWTAAKASFLQDKNGKYKLGDAEITATTVKPTSGTITITFIPNDTDIMNTLSGSIDITNRKITNKAIVPEGEAWKAATPTT